MSESDVLYTCPACGFKTITRPQLFEICDVCNWEDDGTQLHYPLLAGGANPDSLYEWQQKILQRYPLNIQDVRLKVGFASWTKWGRYERDSKWRPLAPGDLATDTQEPNTALEYVDALSSHHERTRYYWLDDDQFITEDVYTCPACGFKTFGKPDTWQRCFVCN